MALPQPITVTVHPFLSSANPHAYACAYEHGNTSSNNALVYIGGLTSGPHTALSLSQSVLSALEESDLGYSIWEFRMRSSYTGWGYSSLNKDVEDIAELVNYLTSLGKKRVVLLGSSTGCQDCMSYMSALRRDAPNIHACILQAPTSDRATANMIMSPEFFRRTLEHCKELIACGNPDSIMPKDLIPDVFTSPISAYRWHSLIAEGYAFHSAECHRLTKDSGDDDYFSDDLEDVILATTFGQINRPTLIIPSENDEMMPSMFPKRSLLSKWIQAAPDGLVSQLSDIVPAADHTLSADVSRRWFTERVVQFLGSLSSARVGDNRESIVPKHTVSRHER